MQSLPPAILSSLSNLTAQELQKVRQSLSEIREKRRTENKLAEYAPYAKQKVFHKLGATCPERLLRAGNQMGKTHAGGAEMAMHLTGEYPAWWDGRRFEKPVSAWAACDTGKTTRDNPQRVLMGEPGSWGTGWIPKHLISEIKRAAGTPDLIDTITIKHRTGGLSRLGFKTYEERRESWQGPPKHVIWADEEMPEALYGEALARLTATRGIIYTTFTPMKGSTGLVMRLMAPGPGKADVNMTIEDAEHIPAAEREAIIARYPAHERKARIYGIPMMGSGQVFPIDEDLIKCDAIPIPEFWPVVGGVDFGWDHPFAAVQIAWDRDSDIAYVCKAYRIRESTPTIQAAALKPWGDYFPWAWPHDGLQHDKGSGKQLASQYRSAGLNLYFEHAQFPPNADGSPGGFGFEAGLTLMLERMQQGRLKVFSHLTEWFEEFRLYHRKDGLVVKERDDLLSATRIALMMLRIAQVKKAPPNNDRWSRNRSAQESPWTA